MGKRTRLKLILTVENKFNTFKIYFFLKYFEKTKKTIYKYKDEDNYTMNGGNKKIKGFKK